jgi:hypothetical protein
LKQPASFVSIALNQPPSPAAAFLYSTCHPKIGCHLSRPLLSCCCGGSRNEASATSSIRSRPQWSASRIYNTAPTSDVLVIQRTELASSRSFGGKSFSFVNANKAFLVGAPVDSGRKEGPQLKVPVLISLEFRPTFNLIFKVIKSAC